MVRPYTPVSFPETPGHLDLVVKVYPEGAMSQHLDHMALGDLLAFKGPIVKLPILKDMKQSIGMIAGGTGITPMLQVIEHVLRTPGDCTTISLVFANKTADDILLKSRLDALAQNHPSRFRVHYIIEQQPAGGGWDGSVGRVTPALLRAHMPPPTDENLVLVCGPPGFMAAVSGDKLPDKSQGHSAGLWRSSAIRQQASLSSDAALHLETVV